MVIGGIRSRQHVGMVISNCKVALVRSWKRKKRRGNPSRFRYYVEIIPLFQAD
jgi:hypothetical protein